MKPIHRGTPCLLINHPKITSDRRPCQSVLLRPHLSRTLLLQSQHLHENQHCCHSKPCYRSLFPVGSSVVVDDARSLTQESQRLLKHDYFDLIDEGTHTVLSGGHCLVLGVLKEPSEGLNNYILLNEFFVRWVFVMQLPVY